MAKDGTIRGGARAGSGPGKKTEAKAIKNEIFAELDDEDIPPESKAIARSLTAWIKKRGCAGLVPKELITLFSQAMARNLQNDAKIDEVGSVFIDDKGNQRTSPYVVNSQNYMKQANQYLFEISQIVANNTAGSGTDYDAQSDSMEALLGGK